MDHLETWQIILLLLMAGLLLFVFVPNMKHAFRKSAEAENKDWMGFILPVTVVVLFVIFLINTV